MKLAFLVALVASMPAGIQASENPSINVAPDFDTYHVIDYDATVTLSGSHAWIGDASKVVDGELEIFDEEGDIVESDALTYPTKDTCNVATADLGYIKVDLGAPKEVDGVRFSMVGERAYCNVFLNVWNEGEEEPMEPLTMANPITMFPTPSPTVAPTVAHKATPNPTTAPVKESVNKKSIKCQVCSGPPQLCEKIYESKTCNYPNNYCINVLDNKLHGRSIVRSCGNFTTCYMDWFAGSSDKDRCRKFDENFQLELEFECTFCCTEDYCNTAINPPKNTLYTEVRRGLTETTQNSNIYHTSTDHKYGPVLSKKGIINVPIVPRRTVRYIKLWVGTNSVTKTDGGGVYEIEALTSDWIWGEEMSDIEMSSIETDDTWESGVDGNFSVSFTVPPGGITKPMSRTASSSGDPHFKLWDGGKFDFHGGCDLVLLDSPRFRNSVGLTIHIRTKIKTWWSYIDSGALKIGEDVLEVTGGEQGSGRAWVNGNPQDLEDGDEFIFGGFPVVYHKVSPVQSRYRIDFGNGDAMSVETFKSFVRINVHTKNLDTFEGALGMMGSYPSGAMMGRDGVSVIGDPDAFGKEWQVQASEPMLFHEPVGVRHPQECAMPDVATKNKRRRLGESLITQGDAEMACQHVEEEEHDACVFDVLATNDKDMAGAY